MASKVSELRVKVRRAMGNPRTTEISDGDIDDIINLSLRKVNKVIPSRLLVSINVTADVQSYLLTDTAILAGGAPTKVRKILSSTVVSALGLTSEFAEAQLVASFASADVTRNPSLKYVQDLRRASYRDAYATRHLYQQQTSTLYILPTPDTTGVRKAIIDRAWLLEPEGGGGSGNLPADLEDMLRYWANYETAKELAARRLALPVFDRDQSRVGSYLAPRDLLKVGEKNEEKFNIGIKELTGQYLFVFPEGMGMD